MPSSSPQASGRPWPGRSGMEAAEKSEVMELFVGSFINPVHF